ncbi:uncharacterized protein TNCV_932191 [Trichonephila clavipes]|nr:uncharacterized protein TNCV_932191 [Trichonephila clavipes]
MGPGDQAESLRTYHMSELYLDVSGVPYHANVTRPIPSQSLHQLKQSPIYMLCVCVVPLIHEVVSISIHANQLDSIGNETVQTTQRVSNHLSPVSVLTGSGDAGSFVSCSQQGYTSRPSVSKAHIEDVSLNG